MPTSYVVLDSGILLATVQTEVHTTRATALIKHIQEQEIGIAAPVLMHYELAAVARKWVYRGIATKSQADKALITLLKYAVDLHFDEALLRRSYELAALYNRPTAYDTQYLAVAERLSCDFWTADERLYNAVSGGLGGIRWIGNFGGDENL